MHVSLTTLQEKNFEFPVNRIKSDFGYARSYTLSAKRNIEAHIYTTLATVCGMHDSHCFEKSLPKHRHKPTHILTWSATALGQSTVQARRRRLQVNNCLSRNRFVPYPRALNSWGDGPCQYHVANGALYVGRRMGAKAPRGKDAGSAANQIETGATSHPTWARCLLWVHGTLDTPSSSQLSLRASNASKPFAHSTLGHARTLWVARRGVTHAKASRCRIVAKRSAAAMATTPPTITHQLG